MAAHVYHEWPDDKPTPVLYDDCPECAMRSKQPWHLDSDRFEKAWKLMVNVEHDGDLGGRDYYLTLNERKLCGELYHFAVVLERYLSIDPWRWPVTVWATSETLSEVLQRDQEGQRIAHTSRSLEAEPLTGKENQ